MDCLSLLRTALCLLFVVAFVAGVDDLPPDQDGTSPDPESKPTNPGHSPGIGHGCPPGGDETDPQPDGSKPTNPGHSPGIGHGHNPKGPTKPCPNNPDQGPEIVPVNPPPTDDTTEPEPDAFKPTTPGDSPGIGHPLRRRF